MIFTDRTIIVQKGTSSINDTIVLYRGDREVEIRFTLNESSPFKFGSGAEPNIIEKTEAAYGQLIIKTPNDLPSIFSRIAPTNEGKIIFTITAEMIDEITEVGNYTFQIRLFDESMNSRATLPEVVDGIEIREPIATEDVTDTNEVGIATVGYALTTAGTTEDAFDSQGNYNKTTWGTGDRITAAKLNKIELGIDGVNKKVANGGTGGGSNINDTTASATTTYSSNKIESIKEELGSQIKEIVNNGNATLNKIEVLEEDPTDNLYEGRIWLYKQPDLSCTSITLDQTNVELTADNKTVTLVATVEPSNTTDNITWSSSATSVATVSDGLVTAKTNGSAVITASCGSQSATCSITVSGFVEQEIGTSNLVLSLSGSDFTNSPQTTTLPDNSGNGNNFTASGFSYTTSSGSNGNGGIVADGTDDKLTISTLNNVNGTNGYTIVMKCSINNLSQTKKYFVEFDSNNINNIIPQLSVIYGFNSKGIQFYDGKSIANININITDTNIHTIAFSYHGTTLTGYLDGAEVSSVTIGTNYLAADLIKGVIFNSTNTKVTIEHINATLYELRLYDKGLTSDEISNITTQLG